jgi:hypothetical protein
MTPQLLAILFIFSPLQGPPLTAPSAETIEQAAVNQRRALKSGDVTIRYQSERWIKPIWRIDVTERIRFAQEKTRIDSWEPQGKLDYDFRSTCRNCEKENSWLTFVKKGPNHVGAVEVKPITPNQPPSFLYDVRLLGIAGGDHFTIMNRNFNTILGMTDRDKPSLERSTWKGQEAWLIKYTKPRLRGQMVRIWIVPGMGHSVARMEVEGTSVSKDGTYHYLSLDESELRQYGEKGVWFPASRLHELKYDGKLVARELAEVKEAVFNEPLPPDTFNFSGMDLAQGAKIVGLEKSGRVLTWDGSKAFFDETSEVVIPEQIAAESGIRSWWLALGCLFAVAASLAVWLYFFRSKGKQSAPSGSSAG